MIFSPPSYIENVAFSPPDDVPVHEFLFGDDSVEKYGRHPKSESLPPFTCGVSGRKFSAEEVGERVEYLARALASELGFEVNDGSELDKVIGVFTLNAVDTLTVSWAAHRLSGVSTPISPSYSVVELTRQLKVTKTKALFTCLPLLPVALESAAAAGIPQSNVYIIDLPEKILKGATVPSKFKTVDKLVAEGSVMEAIPKVEFAPGQGASQVAFLCSSSGTSGLPKNVMISHRNVISNIMQIKAFEKGYKGADPEYSLGVLPLSHSYALIVTGHAGIYRGDGLVVHPTFDLFEIMATIQNYKLARLWMVPPMIVGMIKAASLSNKFDLSSVKYAVVGASNLTQDVFETFSKLFPNCRLLQGYGLTESSVVVCFQHPDDVMFGSCGHLLSGYEARLVDDRGNDVDDYNVAGELLVRTPTMMMGYLDNEEATKGAFTEDGWLRTGDLMEMRKSKGGHDHLFIVDRVKELIKVRGLQVSPVEVEAYLSTHPAIADVTVVSIPNEAAGELPIAFIVKSPEAKARSDRELKDEIHEFVAQELADFKRLAGGIEFVDSLPKTAAAKTQRGTMKQRAKAIYEANLKKAAAPAVVQSFEFDSDDDSEDDE
jgi:acyl-CoA synthetase (AMP-forming)/AMP-acid ligase II